MYRRTRKAQEARDRQLAAMQAERERARLGRPQEPAPAELPDLRMRITVEILDFEPTKQVLEFHKTERVDVYRITVNGKHWKKCGLTVALEGIRKARPRVLSPRAIK
jgi:hypothetical protein